VRKGRLKASNCGSVLNAGRITPSLLKGLFGEYDLSRVIAVQWGAESEAEEIYRSPCSWNRHLAWPKWCSWSFSWWPDSSKSCTGSEVPIYAKKLNNCWGSIKWFILLDKKPRWHIPLKARPCLLASTAFSLCGQLREMETWAENIEIFSDFYFAKLFQKIVEGEL